MPQDKLPWVFQKKAYASRQVSLGVPKEDILFGRQQRAAQEIDIDFES